MQAIGFLIDGKPLRKLAYELAVAYEKLHTSSWAQSELADKDWLGDFLKSHSHLSIRTLGATSVARATGFNRKNVDTFFKTLEKNIQRGQLPPNSFKNLDKTGVQTTRKPLKVIAQTGARQVAQLVSQERDVTATMCGIANALGKSVPFVLLFPRKHFKDHMIHGAPTGTLGIASRWTPLEHLTLLY